MSEINLTKLDDAVSSKVAPKTKNQLIFTNLAAALRQPLTDLFILKFDQFLESLPNWAVERAEALPANLQQRYMEIIPILRRERLKIEQEVGANFDTQFHRFAQLDQSRESKASKAGSSLDAISLEDIGLVSTEDYDVSVALDGVADRLARTLEPDLGHSFQRLKPLSVKLTNISQLPYHPRVLLSVLVDSLSALSLSSEQKIELVHKFAGLLDLAVLNEIKALILPAIETAAVPELGKFQPIKSSEVAEKPKPKTSSDGQGGGSNSASQALPPPTMENGVPVLHVAPNGGFVVDPNLLAQQAQHFAAISQSIATASLQVENRFPFATEQIVAQTELLGMLEKLQAAQPSTPLNKDEIKTSVAAVRDSIRNELVSDEENTQVIAQDETNVIDLVSTLFDYILDDKELPTPMKALISRLQIPVLKVALTDKKFFGGEDHPARKLLNLLAKAGMSWDENNKSSEALYKKVEHVVFVVLNEFRDDLRLFEDLYADFDEFYQQQQARLAAMDARTREAEENRARAETAKTVVQQALNRRLNGLKLPFSIVRLLQEGWRHVLYLSALKEGVESESWKQAVKVVDALIWSMLPPAGDVQWIDRLKAVSPKLINSLRKGLTAVNFDAHQLEVLLAEIVKSHEEIIGGINAPLVEILDPADTNAAKRADATPAVSIEQAISTPKVEVKAVALPVAEVSTIYTGETLPPTDPNVIAVRRMAVGTWVEFVQTEGAIRHRLVAKIHSSEKLIFANKRGIKAAELSMMQLAIELSQNRAIILTEQPQMFDRALLSVVDGLKKLSA
ncbi:MAG: DUF1631 domain-containing protein [Gammaproteobacteria bacterium]|nr:DUF1631 domain-containing protein [Gammaproteobacteria bacterium]